MVSSLVGMGKAYEVGGNIYFDVNSYPEYGKLSRNFGGDLLEGVRRRGGSAEARPQGLHVVESRRAGPRREVG